MTVHRIDAAALETLFRPLAAYSHWGLAVSGGADSMALMHLAARHASAAQGDGPRLTALTVDHGLRPEAAREAAFVSAAAARLGIAHATLRWEGPKPASGVQAAARAARYDLMAEHALAQGIDCLVTAHHLEDQAETVLMRLKRGSGPDGLAGIPAAGRWAGMPVLRPLLDIAPAALEAALRAEGAGWIEDPSNADTRYERVRLRKAMAELVRLGYTAEGFARAARRMRRASEALEAATRGFLAAHARAAEAGYCALDMAALGEAAEEIALRAARRVMEAVRGGETGAGLSRLEALTATLRGGEFRAATLGGCRFEARGGEILVMREAGRKGLGEFGLRPGETRLWDRRFEVAAPRGADAPVTVRALGQRGARQLRARAGRAMELPPAAAASLVSFWRGGELIAVPPLGYAPHGEGPGAGLAARFVNAGIFRGRTD